MVIDALGVGALPDAAAYGDAGTNTLAHLAQAVGGLELPALGALGLGSIEPVAGVAPAARPAIHGRLAAAGPGKDSIAGHWELMGVVLEHALPTYPAGFPEPLVERLADATGRTFICNRPANGVTAIDEFGEEHLRSGSLILYTSQDSVLQLAAHVDRVAPAELYATCALARQALSGEDAVGRVIARPFEGRPGSFARTEGRRDWALAPPQRSYLEALQGSGIAVHAVGKIADLFAGRGIDESHPGATNEAALASVARLERELDAGLIFANLIETDQLYGHRKDVEGFARALREIDGAVGELVARLSDGDLLVITADHGVDPSHPGTDHTREHAPLLAVTGEMVAGGRTGARYDGALADVGASVLAHLGGEPAGALPGRSFLE